jgi:hypothetical protein
MDDYLLIVRFVILCQNFTSCPRYDRTVRMALSWGFSGGLLLPRIEFGKGSERKSPRNNFSYSSGQSTVRVKAVLNFVSKKIKGSRPHNTPFSVDYRFGSPPLVSGSTMATFSYKGQDANKG